MKPRRGDGQHHLSPAVGELRESVKEQDTGSILELEARLEHMHPKTVDVIYKA
jgi:hypothetical protein